MPARPGSISPRTARIARTMPAEAENQAHQRYSVGRSDNAATVPSDSRGHQRYTVSTTPGSEAATASPPWTWRRRATLGLDALIAFGALAAIVLAVVVWTAPLSWWPVQAFLYAPRWLLLIPPALVAVPALVLPGRRPLRLAALALALVVLLGPVVGYCLPWKTYLFAAGTGPRLRVFSANVEGTGLDMKAMTDYLDRTAPDLVCLQECPGTELVEWLRAKGWNVIRFQSQAVASRHPFRSHEPIDLSAMEIRGTATRVVLMLPDGDAVPVLNVHLPTPGPGLYSLMNRRAGGVADLRQVLDAQWAGSRITRERGGPADGLIAVGDFNMTVEAATFRRFWSDLTDAFSRAGSGLGFTRIGGWAIRARIDHILTGPGWRPLSCEVGPDVGSDHRPVFAVLERTARSSTPIRPDDLSAYLLPDALPADPTAAPRLIALPVPSFPFANAIWGSTGRDATGRIWFGVSAHDPAGGPTSAHLMSLDPRTGRVEDRGNVLDQLSRLGLLRPGESQAKIHSRIVPGPDGRLYFASGDEAGGDYATGATNPTWGGHLWRFDPDRPDHWEHLAAAPESLIAAASGGDHVYALGYFGHTLYQFHVPSGRLRTRPVTSAGPHMTRNFACDRLGHAYVPRVRLAQGPAAPAVEIVEFDADLREVAATPLEPGTYFGAMPPGESHGITGVQPLRDEVLWLVTHVGHLYRIRPRQGEPGEVLSAGWLRADAGGSTESLFSPDGTRYLAALANELGGPADLPRWLVRDTNSAQSVKRPTPLGIENIPSDPDPSHALRPLESLDGVLIYGSATRDDQGNAYLGGTRGGRPLLVQARWAAVPPPYPVLPPAAPLAAPKTTTPGPSRVTPPSTPADAAIMRPAPTVAAMPGPAAPPAADAVETPADFHRALRACLDQAQDGSAGHAVHELVKARIGDEGRKTAVGALANLVRRSSVLDRRARIRALRSAGLSEPEVLEALAAHEARSIGARNGPRNVEEAYLRAVQGLLESPPPATGSP